MWTLTTPRCRITFWRFILLIQLCLLKILEMELLRCVKMLEPTFQGFFTNYPSKPSSYQILVIWCMKSSQFHLSYVIEILKPTFLIHHWQTNTKSNNYNYCLEYELEAMINDVSVFTKPQTSNLIGWFNHFSNITFGEVILSL